MLDYQAAAQTSSESLATNGFLRELLYNRAAVENLYMHWHAHLRRTAGLPHYEVVATKRLVAIRGAFYAAVIFTTCCAVTTS